ncbi:ATP synthase F1 subunit gamma [Candidatus Saccharibacteria bacterium RIFCSPHIGHO2_12_FULL_42_8]|nr:MAG: ATP synthase F1 subunit gamma [Candidatus Saccharibacteria bacterium RIFCSPHIGHO2_12_FULL_42_8]
MSAGVTTLKRRIGSVKNTRQITKAMELVAASKMRRAQEFAINSRAFKDEARLLIGQLSGVSDVKLDSLFETREIKTELLIAISSDRGLAGAYNANVFKNLIGIVQENKTKKINTKIVTVGRQAGNFVAKLNGVDHASAHLMLGDHPTPDTVLTILQDMVKNYLDKEIDSVRVIYTQFISNINQEVVASTLIPYVIDTDDKKTDVKELSPLEVAFFEPSVEAIIESTAERLIEAQLWQALLESVASEHSMRMMAMKNASDNAADIIDDLTLELNTARQAEITQQIAEIVGGAEAVKV